MGFFACANSKYSDIDALIEKVKVQRVGLSPTQIAILKNPFIDEKKLKKVIKIQKIKKARKKQRIVYRLSSIFDNRAKINGRWYRVGAKVGRYRLAFIDSIKGFVVLKNKNRSLTLFLHRKSKKIKLFRIN